MQWDHDPWYLCYAAAIHLDNPFLKSTCQVMSSCCCPSHIRFTHLPSDITTSCIAQWTVYMCSFMVESRPCNAYASRSIHRHTYVHTYVHTLSMLCVWSTRSMNWAILVSMFAVSLQVWPCRKTSLLGHQYPTYPQIKLTAGPAQTQVCLQAVKR